MWDQEFGIQHYAGLVTYTVQGFLDKNKDTQQDQLFELMHGSTNVFVQDLTRFQVHETNSQILGLIGTIIWHWQRSIEHHKVTFIRVTFYTSSQFHGLLF